MTRTLRSRFVLPLAFMVLAPLCSLAQTAPFNLPAQPLAESLKAVGAQSNVNVLVTPDLVDGKQAPALKASLSVTEALAALLQGTGLEYHFVNDQTVVIRQKVPPASASGKPLADSHSGSADGAPGSIPVQNVPIAQSNQTQAQQAFAADANVSGAAGQ